MSLPPWHEEAIARRHDRGSFDCGDAALNEFLQRHARQSHERGGAKTFVAVAPERGDGQSILGFYSLSPASLEYSRVPAPVRRGLAHHHVPGFRLARLAVDRSCQGLGLGGQLLLAAGRRCLRVAQEVGGVVMVIDAKNGRVAEWYRSFGALQLLDAPLTLVLPLATVESALRDAGQP